MGKASSLPVEHHKGFFGIGKGVIRPKSHQGANSLAYFARPSATKKKKFDDTESRNWGIADEPIMNKRLGIYQRPLSAHGIRNQQVSIWGPDIWHNDTREYKLRGKAQYS